MWHIIHVIARPVEALLGLFCVLSAIVLYPGEEGRIQSKFEDFWVRVDDYQKLALSRNAAFMTQVAKLQTRFLDRVFGAKLISAQALAVSFCCSVATFSLLFIYSDYIELGHHNTGNNELLLFTGFFCCSLTLGILIVIVRQHIVVRWMAGFAALIFFTAWTLKWEPDPGIAAAVILFAAALGFGCDAIFIALTRYLVRWAGEMTSLSKVLTTVMLNLLLGLLLVSPLLFSLGDSPNPALLLSDIVAVSNVFDAALALLFVLLAVTLLLHRAL